MEYADGILALLVASLVVLVAIFVRQGQLILLINRLFSSTEKLPAELEAEISRLVMEQKKMEAIKLYRSSCGASLAEAVAVVDRLSSR